MSKSIIIDAGHGGKDPGAIGFSEKEKDWALEMSRYQFHRLKALGAKVALTRKEDTTLTPTERVARIKNQYDICLSNHWNAFDGSARGIETIHSVKANPRFAKDLADRLARSTQLPFRRVFSRAISPGVDYYFLHRLTGKTETVIIEYGFIDHPMDHAYYKDQKSFYIAAEAVIAGVCQKIGIPYKEPGERFVKKPTNSSQQMKLESIYDGKLRFYNQPSWKDADVFGYLEIGQGFPKIIEKMTVGKGEQFKVENSKGETFYITAHPKYVKVK
ncbi:N-acetylmuramoyl-L-alanine amidase [Marinilactibacillus sp. GCM10026970]|uniref:N-acetylmuramoyl-L-alanine amidase family protein n=1 Tax=Marinilactibacillus sp. GCM10026970 TaxID=3252642 RepID=UPI003619B77D